MSTMPIDEWRAGHRGVVGDVAGSRLVRHYGDPQVEYAALRERGGIVDRGDLSQFRVWGRDPVRMINGLITNDLREIASRERAAYAAMLTPKGRMISDLRVFVAPGEPSELILDVPGNAKAAVADHLKRYVPPLFARWDDAPYRVLGIYGPLSASVVAVVLRASPETVEDTLTTGTYHDEPVPIVSTVIAGGEIGFDVFLPVRVYEAAWEELRTAILEKGGTPAGFAALEALRIEAGRPRFGLDMTHESLPGEAFETTGLMSRAVSFTKGCYTGQEVVVRIAHRGHVNRHLRGLLLGEAPSPPYRTPLFGGRSGDREVGWITSATSSPWLGQTVALGVLRREIEVGETVRVGEAAGVPAEVTELPFRPIQG